MESSEELVESDAMGLYDRDYYRTPQRGGVGSVRVWSITTWLIIINIAVFVVDVVMRSIQTAQAQEMEPWRPVRVDSALFQWGYFSIAEGIRGGQVWRFISYAFLHYDPWHLLMNMVGLWLFGPVVELNLGVRRYVFFYFLCVVAGPAMYALLWGLGLVVPGGPSQLLIHSMQVPMIGASAGVFGVLLGAAHLSPDRPINVYFMEVPLKYLAWFMVGLAAFGVLTHSNNAGGEAAHLGGALAGFLLIRQEAVLDIVLPKRVVRGRKVKDWSRDMNR